jgi:hypothetical protein
MGGRYYRLSTFVVAAFEIGRRTVGGVFSKAQRVDRNEAKRRQKEGAATLQRFKTQDADRARAAAALVAAGSRRAEARALAMRLEQEEEEEPSS